MPPRVSRPPTLDSLLPPILSLLTATPPNAYSAHQKALTTTARLVHSGHGALAIEILAAAARELLKIGEAASGVELAVRMIDVMTETGVDVNDKSRASITQLLALTLPAGPWRKKLVDTAVRWSVRGGCPTGDPSLHQYVGELYYKDRLFLPAEQHLLASGKRDAASLLADLMFDWCDKGALDPGPYALRGTLPFLAQAPPNVLPATVFLARFISLLSAPSAPSAALFVSTVPSQTPEPAVSEIHITTSVALNFAQLAVLTVQRAPAPGVSGVQARGTDGGVARDWTALVQRYRRISGTNGVLEQKEVLEVIDHISASVFLIPARNAGGNDLLQNLMGSLFGGGGGGGGPLGIGAR